MCKIMAITGITSDNEKFVRSLIHEAVRPLTKQDSDGFGWVGITALGHLAGERWLDASKAFTVSSGDPSTYNSFGDISQSFVTILLHARYATCEKTLANTHPFVKDGVALIHNGVITNAESFTRTLSTCDSEAILTQYTLNNVSVNPEEANPALNPLRGYYACAVLGTDVEGAPYLDIFRSSMASLSKATLDVNGLTIFCTTIGIIHDALWLTDYEDVPAVLATAMPVPAEFLFRFNAITGQLIESHPFVGPSYITPSTSSYSRYADELDYEERLQQLEEHFSEVIEVLEQRVEALEQIIEANDLVAYPEDDED